MEDLPERFCEVVRRNNPHLWLGMEWQISMPLMFLCIYIFYFMLMGGHPIYGIMVSFLVWKSIGALGKKLAKIDSCFIRVYSASFRWKKFYPARTHVAPKVAVRR